MHFGFCFDQIFLPLSQGLFYADDSFRPVPLSTQYIGVTEKNRMKRRHHMNVVAYKKVLEALQVRLGQMMKNALHQSFESSAARNLDA